MSLMPSGRICRVGGGDDTMFPFSRFVSDSFLFLWLGYGFPSLFMIPHVLHRFSWNWRRSSGVPVTLSFLQATVSHTSPEFCVCLGFLDPFFLSIHRYIHTLRPVFTFSFHFVFLDNQAIRQSVRPSVLVSLHWHCEYPVLYLSFYSLNIRSVVCRLSSYIASQQSLPCLH
jgi:hypothetical protein